LIILVQDTSGKQQITGLLDENSQQFKHFLPVDSIGQNLSWKGCSKLNVDDNFV